MPQPSPQLHPCLPVRAARHGRDAHPRDRRGQAGRRAAGLHRRRAVVPGARRSTALRPGGHRGQDRGDGPDARGRRGARDPGPVPRGRSAPAWPAPARRCGSRSSRSRPEPTSRALASSPASTGPPSRTSSRPAGCPRSPSSSAASTSPGRWPTPPATRRPVVRAEGRGPGDPRRRGAWRRCWPGPRTPGRDGPQGQDPLRGRRGHGEEPARVPPPPADGGHPQGARRGRRGDVVEEYRKKIAGRACPRRRKQAERELERLERMSEQSPGVRLDPHLPRLADRVPWNVRTEDNLDIAEARRSSTRTTPAWRT